LSRHLPDLTQLGVILLFLFSSTRRPTSSKRDWSSDVCSSDLPQLMADGGLAQPYLGGDVLDAQLLVVEGVQDFDPGGIAEHPEQIGRASCRERGQGPGRGGRRDRKRRGRWQDEGHDSGMAASQ